MLTGAAAYSLIYEPQGNLDVMAGARLWSLSDDLDLNGGVLDGRSSSVNYLEAVDRIE